MNLNTDKTYKLGKGTAGLSITGDNMTLAGAAHPANQLAMQGHRDHFTGLGAGHFTNNAAHPAAGIFAAARALTNGQIAAHPEQAARILRMAKLSERAGAGGTGDQGDAGYIMSLTGNALTQVLPNASQ